MKKIFILPILIAPIVARATNPVGPSAVGQGETPVVATVSAPYATAGAETGDTTNVVSASYVKGAYNDAIAAVNKVNADKQGKLLNGSNNHTISSNVVGGSTVGNTLANYIGTYGWDNNSINGWKANIAQEMGVQNLDDALISADVVINAVNAIGNVKQGTLTNSETDEEVGSVVMSKDYFGTPGVLTGNDEEFEAWYDDIDQDIEGIDNTLMSSAGVISLVRTAANQMKDYNNSKRVSAVTTWGDDTHPTKLQLTNQ